MAIGSELWDFLGAQEARRSAMKAAAANDERVRQQQEAMDTRFHQSRGQGGFAILPEYGGAFEAKSFNDLAEAYDALNSFYGVGANRLQRFADLTKPYQEMAGQAADVGRGIFSGANTDKRLGFAAPVQQSRLNFARGQQQAIKESLLERTNRLAAEAGRRGFVGGGSTENNRMLLATVGARQQAAGAMSRAELENAIESAGIRAQGLDRQERNLALPTQLAQQRLLFEMLPASAQAQLQQQLQAPFSFYRLGTAQAATLPMPQVQAYPSNLQLISGIASDSTRQAVQLAASYFGGPAAGAAVGGSRSGTGITTYGGQSPEGTGETYPSDYWGTVGASPGGPDAGGGYLGIGG